MKIACRYSTTESHEKRARAMMSSWDWKSSRRQRYRLHIISLLGRKFIHFFFCFSSSFRCNRIWVCDLLSIAIVFILRISLALLSHLYIWLSFTHFLTHVSTSTYFAAFHFYFMYTFFRWPATWISDISPEHNLSIPRYVSTVCFPSVTYNFLIHKKCIVLEKISELFLWFGSLTRRECAHRIKICWRRSEMCSTKICQRCSGLLSVDSKCQFSRSSNEGT